MTIIATPWCETPQSDSDEQLHPVVKINYVPRIIAFSFYLLMTWSIWGAAIFSLQLGWMILLALFWPHLARYISGRSPHGKRQEMINMHLDALFAGLFCLLSPAFYFISVVLAILCANALFIGFYRLLLSTLSVFGASLTFAFWVFPPADFLELSRLSETVSTIFLVTYFSSFGAIGYFLTRQMIQLNQQVQSLSLTDTLTGSYNRLYLEQNLTKEIHRCHRLKYPLTLIFADLDHFKSINDQYGHAAGDEILKQFVSLARQCFRDDVDWIARFGGEEFVIVLPNSNAENGSLVAERIRRGLDQHKFQIQATDIHVTCSFGVSSVNAESGEAEGEAETLLACADNGLYQAKANGRNRVEIVTLDNEQASRETKAPDSQASYEA